MSWSAVREILADKNHASEWLCFASFSAPENQTGCTKLYSRIGLWPGKGCSELLLCSLGFNFLTLVMKFSISLGRSREKEESSAVNRQWRGNMGKEKLSAFRDPSSCKLKNICGKTELKHRVGFQGNYNLSEHGEEKHCFWRGCRERGLNLGLPSLPKNLSPASLQVLRLHHCYFFFLNVIPYLMCQEHWQHTAYLLFTVHLGGNNGGKERGKHYHLVQKYMHTK